MKANQTLKLIICHVTFSESAQPSYHPYQPVSIVQQLGSDIYLLLSVFILDVLAYQQKNSWMP